MAQQVLSKKKISFRSVLCFLFLLFYLSVVNNNIYGQVTIGSGNPPAKGALLDLKENEAPGGDITSTKGIIFPRVNLTDLTSLVPLLSTADASDATQKTTHRGTIVYNVAVTANLTEGLYCWDGTKWVRVSSAGNEAWLTQGNAQTDTTRNFLGTTDNQALIFKVNNVRAGMLSSIDGFTNATAFGYKALSGGSTGEANNAFGYNALTNNTTGAGNSAFGLNALAGNITGGNNTAVGNRALANTTADSNTAVGSLALTENRGGAGNTAVGQNTLSSNVGGGDNTALGIRSLVNNTEGRGNVAVGSNAMAENKTGGDNTALGTYSLSLLGSSGSPAGDRNTAIGLSAGRELTSGSNNIIIGANTNVASPTGSNQMNIGYALFGTGMDGATRNPVAPAGNIGIRTAAPTSTLTVNGSYAGKYQVITSNYSVVDTDYNIILAGGTATSNSKITATLPAKGAAAGTFTGREYYFKNVTASDTLVIQTSATTENIRYGAGVSSTPSRVVPPGSSVRLVATNQGTGTTTTPSDAWEWFLAYNATPAWSTRGNAGTDPTQNFLGTTDNQPLAIRVNNTRAGYISNSASTNYNAIGLGALAANTGANNNAFGLNALTANTTGTANTAVGSGTLSANVANSNNTAVGSQALQFNTADGNTALGAGTLKVNTSGSGNVAVGNSAMSGNTAGYNNVAVGASASTGNISGNNNVSIGYQSGNGILTGSNTIAIGANAIFQSDGSNKMNIGNLVFGTGMTGTSASNPAGNIGIMTAPASGRVLHVNAANNPLRFQALPKLATGAVASPLVIDSNGDVYTNNTASATGQVFRHGLDAVTYSGESALRFNQSQTAQGNAPNGANNFINTITGCYVSYGVSMGAGQGTVSRTADRIALTPGVYKVTVRLVGSFNRQNNGNTIFIKAIIDNNEYSLINLQNGSDQSNCFYFEDYIIVPDNAAGGTQTLDFSLGLNSGYTFLTASSNVPSGSTGNSLRSLLLIERLR